METILAVYMKQDPKFVKIIRQNPARMKSALKTEKRFWVIIPANRRVDGGGVPILLSFHKWLYYKQNTPQAPLKADNSPHLTPGVFCDIKGA